MSFFKELKRRNVFRIAVAYLVLGWVAMQVSDVLVNALELPALMNKAVLALLAIGLIPTLVFSWVYEMTPEGVKRESEINRNESITTHTAKKLDLVVILLLMVAIVMFATDRYLRVPGTVNLPLASSKPVNEISEVPVVAVLPLQALSTEDEGVFLAAGLHDDLLTRLARLQAFRVISRTSVMEYANTTKNMRQIGEELGAGFILEGGLQAIGGRVRINAQLIDTETDEHLWANTFDKELTTANLFEVQAEIATAIAEAMHAALSPDDVETMQGVPTQNLAAYRAYLKAYETRGNLSKPALHASIEWFRKAVELDPNFAEAWAGLSLSLARRYWEEGGEWDASPDVSLRDASSVALQRAQAIDPGGVETLMSEAYYSYYGFRDYSTALIVLGRAEALSPHNQRVIALRGFLLRRLGRLSESADALLLSLEGNPNSAPTLREALFTLMASSRCQEASALAAVALGRYPTDDGVLNASARISLHCDENVEAGRQLAERIKITTLQQLRLVVKHLLYAQDYDAAILALTSFETQMDKGSIGHLTITNLLTWLYRKTGQQVQSGEALRAAVEIAASLGDTGATTYAQRALTSALSGDVKATLDLGEQTLASLPNDAYLQPVFRYRVVKAYTIAGAVDEALTQLEIMLSEPGGSKITVLMIDPFLAPLRTHSRFQNIVKNLPAAGETR